jgi:putative membrane protein
MALLTQVLVALVAFLHLWFLVLEMFLWTTPLGLKTFRMSPEKAEATSVLAKSQGLYNGFLAAGLIWSLATGNPVFAQALQCFFLGCVIVAGVYGAMTVGKKILFIQALPAAIALVCSLLQTGA